MAKATATKAPAAPEPKPEPQVSDEVLVAATHKLHEPHGELKEVKVVGAHVNGTNAKGQLVITTVEAATAHARKLGYRPDLDDDSDDDSAQ